MGSVLDLHGKIGHYQMMKKRHINPAVQIWTSRNFSVHSNKLLHINSETYKQELPC